MSGSVSLSQLWEEKTNAFLAGARGVVHIGANTGQERDLYASLGLAVLWVEPLQEAFEILCSEIAEYPDQRAVQYLLTGEDGKEYDFGIANNGGQSSSIFEFADHREIWPHVDYLDSRKLISTTFKTMVEREAIDLGQYDALIMDVQGAELLVLQGAGDLLQKFTWIRAECADFEIYKGCCQLKDLDAFLFRRGFDRVNLWRGAGKPEIGYAYEALYKRSSIEQQHLLEVNARVAAVASIPRLGYQAHFGCAQKAFRCDTFDIPLWKYGGAYWEQGIQRGLTALIADNVAWAITVDYDSIFDSADVKELLILAAQYPEADAIVPWQIRRGGHGMPLFAMEGPDGKLRSSGEVSEFECDLTPIVSGHFGLTLIKTAALGRVPKPWFWSQPGPDGEWEDGRLDADMYFWKKFREAGCKAFLANNVRIGHIEERIVWCDRNFEIQTQTIRDWNENGKPEGVR